MNKSFKNFPKDKRKKKKMQIEVSFCILQMKILEKKLLTKLL